MGDIKLFRTVANNVQEIEGRSVALERSLQTLIDRHLESFLGVRYLATEYATGKTHAGRIDTLGIDEDGCPCIIEYKRSVNENVINQGLFYLDWLLDHKGEFELLVLKTLGADVAQSIEWSGPRLVCIAGDFTRYDEHAVQQINRNVELIKYARFGDELLLLELINAVQVKPTPQAPPAEGPPSGGKQTKDKTVEEHITSSSPALLDLFALLSSTLCGFGSDVQQKQLKHYIAFKRIKNFATVQIYSTQDKLLVWVKVHPDTITLEKDFTRDVRKIGHWGTGDLEITLRTAADVQKAFPLFQTSYDAC